MIEFDVFVSHNSKDKPVVQGLVDKLKSRGIRVWYDVDRIDGGDSTIKKLEEAVDSSRTYAILVGKNGFGIWHEQEMEVCLLRAATDKNKKVMAVLLSGFHENIKLNPFLDKYTRINLQNGFDTNDFERFVQAILKGKPKRPQLHRNSNKDNHQNSSINEADSYKNKPPYFNTGKKDQKFVSNPIKQNSLTYNSIERLAQNIDKDNLSVKPDITFVTSDKSNIKPKSTSIFTILSALAATLLVFLLVIFTKEPTKNSKTNTTVASDRPHSENTSYLVVLSTDPKDAKILTSVNGVEKACITPCQFNALFGAKVEWKAYRDGYQEKTGDLTVSVENQYEIILEKID